MTPPRIAPPYLDAPPVDGKKALRCNNLPGHSLLVRRMDAVAAVYRLAASMSSGIDGLRSHVEFHRRGRFDATITLHDGRTFGVVRQGLGPAAPVSLRPAEGHSGVRL